MALYAYIAFNKTGKEVKDIIEANNLQAARTKLKQKGLYVKSIKEDEEKKDRELLPFIAKFLYSVPRKQVVMFIRQLGTLIGAGIPLDKSLNNISEQVENRNLKKIIIDIRASITEGQSLSQAMTKYPDVFPNQYPSLISVGEKTGEYENTLLRLSDLEEASLDMKAKVQTAMVYPFIMGLVSSAVAIFLLVFVVPQIQDMYQQFGAELPFITKFVLAISNILTNFWWLLIAVAVGGGIGFSTWKNSPNGKRIFDTYFIKIPIFGKLTRKVLVSNFARNLGVLLTNRVSLLTALTIVSNVVNHYIFQTEITSAIDKIKEGEKLSSAFQNSTVLPPMVLGMIAAGEISDTVPQMMNKLADIYDKEVDTTIKSMMQSLEPLLLVVMGFVIFGIMAAIMTPMFKLTQEIQNL